MRIWTIDLNRSRVCLEEAIRLAQAGYTVRIVEDRRVVAHLVLTSTSPVQTRVPGLAQGQVHLPEDDSSLMGPEQP